MLHAVIPGVVFSAMEPGEHNVRVTRDGNDIAGSPFSVMIADSEIAHADGVKVYGRGLSEGQTGQPCQFFIDTSNAGKQRFLCSVAHSFLPSCFPSFIDSFVQ